MEISLTKTEWAAVIRSIQGTQTRKERDWLKDALPILSAASKIKIGDDE